ncbi:MAG: hypothetical protein L0J64_09655, partial [Corynebacterium sp.]|nr:hypothetical protein [Corynebacterium sp.]
MSYTTTTRTPTRAGWLVSLMLVTFVIGTDDFIIAGILPDIADDLAVSEAAAIPNTAGLTIAAINAAT